MIERIILDIKHSDDYTDYLFQTAALKNRRIIPMVGPSDEELDAVKDESTIIYRCEASFNNSILPVGRPVYRLRRPRPTFYHQVIDFRPGSVFYLQTNSEVCQISA